MPSRDDSLGRAVLGGVVLTLLLGSCDGLLDSDGLNEIRVVGSDGGTLRNAAVGVSLTIPPSALIQPVTVSLFAQDGGPGSVGAIDIGPPSVYFWTPATLAYDIDRIPPGTYGPGHWKIHRNTGAIWVALPTRRDPAQFSVRGNVEWTGRYALRVSVEQCRDGLDNDGDGRSDCADGACEGVEPCNRCFGSTCASGQTCCPFTRACVPVGCDGCCSNPWGGGDAGQPLVCGFSVCYPPFQACSDGVCVTTDAGHDDGGTFYGGDGGDGWYPSDAGDGGA